MSKNTRVIVKSETHEHNGRKCLPGQPIEVDASLVAGLVAAGIIEDPAPESAPAPEGGKKFTPRKES